MGATNLSPTQSAANELIKCDLQYLYTIICNTSKIHSNYVVSMVPYIGLIIDGIEDWISAVNNSSSNVIHAPIFTAEEQKFYEIARDGVKLFGKDYSQLYSLFQQKYSDSDNYFSSCCKPIARKFHLYDIYGADLTNNGHFCGNTILGATYLPGFNLGDTTYGPKLKMLMNIAGRYISLFNAKHAFSVDPNVQFQTCDFGGFTKSPVGNSFSHRFVILSILCQINFILWGVDQYIIANVPTKLRFSYILYYYLCDLLPDINRLCDTHFTIDTKYYSRGFRNTMAHYKVGVYLKPSDIIQGDPLFGMTQKAFNQDYYKVKHSIITELTSLASQLENWLGIQK